MPPDLRPRPQAHRRGQAALRDDHWAARTFDRELPRRGPKLASGSRCWWCHLRTFEFDELLPHGAPLLGGNWNDPVEAVADLLHLWQFRDIRFFVSEHYLRDGKLTFKRRKVREQVVRELSLDFVMRGGFDTVICDVEGEDTRLLCYGSPQHRRAARRYTPTPTRLHAKDRPLLADALEGGCHVFLTSDKGVLARAPPSSPAAVSPS